MFSRFFTFSEQKKHRKYRCFWLRANAKPRYLRGFEPLLAKITVFTVFCGPGLAKTLVFTQFPACCQKFFGMPKAQKHCKLHDFYAWTVPKKQENRPKNAQQGPPKRIFKFYPLFSHPEPQKRENPSRLKDFRGGSAAGARPRVAKAMLSCHHYTARHRRIYEAYAWQPGAGKSRPVSPSWCCCCGGVVVVGRCWPYLGAGLPLSWP